MTLFNPSSPTPHAPPPPLGPLPFLPSTIFRTLPGGAVCGNQLCEYGEECRDATCATGGQCKADCPAPFKACPTGSGALGAADAGSCSGHGVCGTATGVCLCYHGCVQADAVLPSPPPHPSRTPSHAFSLLCCVTHLLPPAWALATLLRVSSFTATCPFSSSSYSHPPSTHPSTQHTMSLPTAPHQVRGNRVRLLQPELHAGTAARSLSRCPACCCPGQVGGGWEAPCPSWWARPGKVAGGLAHAAHARPCGVSMAAVRFKQDVYFSLGPSSAAATVSRTETRLASTAVRP